MKTKIRTLISRVNLKNYVDNLFNPPQRLQLINTVFVFVVIGFIAGTVLKGCGISSDRIKANVSNSR